MLQRYAGGAATYQSEEFRFLYGVETPCCEQSATVAAQYVSRE